jgi:hypothetical protein
MQPPGQENRGIVWLAVWKIPAAKGHSSNGCLFCPEYIKELLYCKEARLSQERSQE